MALAGRCDIGEGQSLGTFQAPHSCLFVPVRQMRWQAALHRTQSQSCVFHLDKRGHSQRLLAPQSQTIYKRQFNHLFWSSFEETSWGKEIWKQNKKGEEIVLFKNEIDKNANKLSSKYSFETIFMPLWK